MTTVQEILDAAQALPSGDRAQIISALWNSVSADDWTPPGETLARFSDAVGLR